VKSIFALTDKQPRRSRDTSLETPRKYPSHAPKVPVTSADRSLSLSLSLSGIYSEKLLNATRLTTIVVQSRDKYRRVADYRRCGYPVTKITWLQ